MMYDILKSKYIVLIHLNTKKAYPKLYADAVTIHKKPVLCHRGLENITYYWFGESMTK